MSELFNDESRVFLPTKEQRKFIVIAQKRSGLSSSLLAKQLGVHARTLRDWRRELYSIPFKALKEISILAHMPLPKNLKLRGKYWYTVKGASLGGHSTFKKYGYAMGNPEKREKNWRKWWKEKGKFHPLVRRKMTKKPAYSRDLAEFVGIMMGDGGISPRQTVISLNPKTDTKYVKFVCDLIAKLFGVTPGIHRRKEQSVACINVSRTDHVEYCHSLGLPIGNKLRQKLDIPKWIQNNDNFAKSCIRGLMDTDGCIFNECHRIKKKLYCYPRMSFVSHSPYLRASVSTLLRKFGFQPNIRNEKAVTLVKRVDIVRYFELIGTSNNKHLTRFRRFTGGVG